MAIRQAHPAWGGRKIRRVLETQGCATPPSASTITEILRRRGLLEAPADHAPAAGQRFEHPAPNDLWQMDFKGHFALGQGRCHPLTILDDHSRYALELGACADEQTLTVRERLQPVFERYGLPRRILADNGSPWGASGGGRHTRLTVWPLRPANPKHNRSGCPRTPVQLVSGLSTVSAGHDGTLVGCRPGRPRVG